MDTMDEGQLPLRVGTLCSGSKGNAVYIEYGGTSVLIDCGISCRALTAALAQQGRTPDDLDGVFVTHEHSDHVRGLKMLMKKHRVPIHMTQSTADAYCAENAGVDAERIVCHPSVFSERVGGVTVSSFPTSHDSVQSVGYRISAGNLAVAVATDMGYVSDSVRQNLLGAKYVVLESNHDENMLLLGPYPYHLKRRILSRRGHLSNDDAEEALADDRKLIEAAEKAGIRVAVIHPSFEPIPEADRAKRIENAKKNLKLLNQTAKEHGIVLALENLPRTCLGNHSEEMIELLKATGTSFIFDTNHSLDEDNVEFLRNMIAHGYCPVSLHISDYDFIDERHDLPGHGINQWGKLLDLLENAGYSGPALYEIRHLVSEERIISFDEVTENINSLLNGDIK